MTPERRVHIPTLAEIRRETAAAFMTSPDDDLTRAHVISALLAILIPVLLIQLALISAVAHSLPAFLLCIAVLAAALVLALRGRGRWSGGVALIGLIGIPAMTILTRQPSSFLISLLLMQATFGALVIGLVMFRPRTYLLFVLIIFAGILFTGEVTRIGGPNSVLILTFGVTVMLELASVVLVVVVFRLAEQRSRRAAENELRASEERYRRISSLMGDAVYSIQLGPGPVHGVDWMSGRGAFTAFTNLPAEGMLAVHDIVCPADLPRFRKEMAPVREGGQASVEVRLFAPDGEIRWVRVSAYGMKDPATGAVTTIYGALEDIHDRKLAEEALHKERERFENLVNSVDGVVYEYDTSTHETVFISRQVEKLLGYPAQAFLDNPQFWIECIHPDDRKRSLAYSTEMAKRRVNWNQHYRSVAADGTIVWMHDIVSLNFTPGKPPMAHGFALNETASQQARQAEQEQRRVREALRETTAAISATLDLNEVVDRMFSALRLTTPSDAADIMFVEDGIARVFRARDFAGSADLDEMLRIVLPVAETGNLRRMTETGQPMLINDVANDPEWVVYMEANWIKSTCSVPIRLDEQTIGFLNLTSTRPHAFTLRHAEYLRTFADQIAIAVRNARLYEQARHNAEMLGELVKQRTAELELERERLSVMLDSTAEGIYYTEGRAIRYANPALCAMTGYTLDELIGAMTDQLAPTLTDELLAGELAITGVLRNERVWRGDKKLRRKDGSLMDAGLTVSVISPPDAPDLRLVVLVRDVSREKALQMQQSNLVAYASHELRTPITNLKTRLYLLRRRPERLDEHVEILEEVTERMRRLVEDLLDLTRMERGITRLSKRVTDMVALTDGIYRLQLPEAERKGLNFTARLPDTPIYADADPERITQVITNLVTNALNYTPAGGAVALTIHPAAAPECVLIEVQDSGVGISAESLPYIFQPFYRVASAVEGAGLGLSIAREIVELHGGEISVQSQKGTGSVFTVRLPAVEAPAVVTGSG
ncbi:MAG: PAS domain-containing protein [Anaerolineae bacterium]|nr:PAS domain-containing protein [Anaerolineae bacterium]